MARRLTTIFTATAILAGLGTATAAVARDNPPSSPSPPVVETTGQDGMMGQHGGGMMDNGMMGTDQMGQMTRMAENCNRMMESMMSPAPNGKAAPQPKG